MKKRVFSLLVALTLACTMFIGCSRNPNNSNEEQGTTEDNWQTYQEKTGDDAPVTVSWWVMGGLDEYYQYYWKEMKGLQEIQKITGVGIDFKVATSYDVYLPMMTAETYPDIITGKNLMQYRGRLSAMYHDGVSIKLNDMMEEYMPNFSAIIEEYPNMARDLKLDTGDYTFVSSLYDIEDKTDRAAASLHGLAIRQDWLSEVGKEIPTNMEEWFDVLLAFKKYDPNQNGLPDEEPVCMASSGWKYFLTAYGIDDDPSILKDGTIVYGFTTKAYKEYLMEMKKWNDEELIYNMFSDTSLEKMRERVTGNLSGAWKGSVVHFDTTKEDTFISQLRKVAPNAELAAVPWPKTADGYQWCYSDINSFDSDTTVITKKAIEHGVQYAAAYLVDYMLSERGSAYVTWGIEGESYEEVNGEKRLLEGMDETVDFHGASIEKINTYADPIKVQLPQFGQLSSFVLASKEESYVKACETWSIGDTQYKCPAACQLSVEQQDRVLEVTEGMKDYIRKMRQKFITGVIPLTSYDTYVDQVNQMGAAEYASIWQDAYDAYLNR